MSELQQVRIVRKDEVSGTLTEYTQDTTASEPQFLARFDDGLVFIIPRSQLLQRDQVTFYLDYTRADLERFAAEQHITIPVIEESLHVEKRKITTGGVRIRKTIQEHEEVVEEPLLKEHVAVERVAVNRVANDQAALKPRQDGDTLIIPVVEEVLVLQKQYLITEEIHVTKTSQLVTDQQTVTLRQESVSVEPINPHEPPTSA